MAMRGWHGVGAVRTRASGALCWIWNESKLKNALRQLVFICICSEWHRRVGPSSGRASVATTVCWAHRRLCVSGDARSARNARIVWHGIRELLFFDSQQHQSELDCLPWRAAYRPRAVDRRQAVSDKSENGADADISAPQSCRQSATDNHAFEKAGADADLSVNIRYAPKKISKS